MYANIKMEKKYGKGKEYSYNYNFIEEYLKANLKEKKNGMEKFMNMISKEI